MRLLLVGGGPAGATAAMQARELGADVTLLEAHVVGGNKPEQRTGAGPTLPRAVRLARDRSPGMNGPDADHPAEGTLIL